MLAMIFGSATLAAIVVMVCIQPQTRREWAVALICTVLSSMSGGSAVVMWLGLHAWALDFFGLMGLAGLFFACGLPGWVVVRWAFAWVHAHPGQSPLGIVREIREAIFK